MHYAIVVYYCHYTRWSSVVAPQPAGDPTPAIRPCQRGSVVRVVLRRLQHLNKADARPDWTCRRPSAFFGAVPQAKFQGIHAELFAQNIDGCFHSKGAGGDARRAVGRRLRLIHDDIKTFDPGVGNLIGSHDPMTGRGHWGAWE